MLQVILSLLLFQDCLAPQASRALLSFLAFLRDPQGQEVLAVQGLQVVPMALVLQASHQIHFFHFDLEDLGNLLGLVVLVVQVYLGHPNIKRISDD